ncbi:MAG: hypothetical protein ABI778_10335 [Ignavibacteriota bacterium]
MQYVSIKQYLSHLAFFGVAAVAVSGCTESTNAPEQSGERVTFMTQIDNKVDHSSSTSFAHSGLPIQGNTIDSVEITGAAFFSNSMNLFSTLTADQTDVNREEVELRTSPFILDFESTGKQYVGDKLIPNSSYRSIKFSVSIPPGNASEFGKSYTNYFQNAPGTSTVIRGNVWTNGEKAAFEYRSAIVTSEIAIFTSPFLIPSAAQSTEVDIKIKTSTVFGTGIGKFLDPRDSRNAATITQNLGESLRAVQLQAGS